MTDPIAPPDVSGRPFDLTVERRMDAAPAELYAAWAGGFGRWFAAPETVLGVPAVNQPFFFEVHPGDGRRFPHYGRFLRLVPDELVELTWLTGPGGTEGAETVVTVTFAPENGGSRLRLHHAGFGSAAARDNHETAWPHVLAHLDAALTGS